MFEGNLANANRSCARKLSLKEEPFDAVPLRTFAVEQEICGCSLRCVLR